MSRLYPGQWVAIAGTKEVGWLVREATYFGDPGWYVRTRDDVPPFWVRVGNLIPWTQRVNEGSAAR